MHPSFAQLRAACLPFVTRTFRGQRWRRSLLLSAVLAVVSLLSGLWLAQGNGDFEHEVRRELGVEASMWEREETEYTVITREDWHYATLKSERDQLIQFGLDATPDYGQLNYTVEEGLATLRAATAVESPREHRELAERARLLLAAEAPESWDPDARMRGFSWYEPHDVQRLQHIVDQRLVPTVTRYESPLGVGGTIRFIGLVAGGIFATLLLIAAPLLAGVQIAQEVHENTLQPVTGTSLSPRQLVLGLTSGPLAQVGVLAVPQALLLVVAAAAAGSFLPALGFVVMAVVVGVLSSMLTQLIGFGAGRRRAPGIIGVALLAILGGSLMAGVGVGFNLNDDMLGLVTVIPQSGVSHLLREAFVPAERLSVADAINLDIRLVFSAVAFAVLAGVVHLALERRVAGRTAPSLRPHEAWLAVGTLIIAALLAIPDFGSDRHQAVATYFVSMGMLVVPFMLVLMGRVTVGDSPSTLRTVPMRSLLGTFGGYLLAHLVVVSAIVGGPQELLPLSAPGMVHLGWGLAVAALIAIRAVAVPLKPASTVWTAICLVLAVIEFGIGVVLNAEAHSRGDMFHAMEHAMPLFEVSVVLGLLEVALMVWVPVSLVRAIRRGSAGTA